MVEDKRFYIMYASWPEISKKARILVFWPDFLKNGDFFFFNNNKAIAKLTFKDNL